MSLTVSGSLSREEQNVAAKIPSLSWESKMLSRQQIAKIYQDKHFIVAPSSQEGLSLNLYEALACNCGIITTDAPPMNEVPTPYLCQAKLKKQTGKLVPMAEITADAIYQKIKQAYEENYGQQ